MQNLGHIFKFSLNFLGEIQINMQRWRLQIVFNNSSKKFTQCSLCFMFYSKPFLRMPHLELTMTHPHITGIVLLTSVGQGLTTVIIQMDVGKAKFKY